MYSLRTFLRLSSAMGYRLSPPAVPVLGLVALRPGRRAHALARLARLHDRAPLDLRQLPKCHFAGCVATSDRGPGTYLHPGARNAM